MDAPSRLSYATLDELLAPYQSLFHIRTLVSPSSALSFSEQFQYLLVTCTVTPDLDVVSLREVLELYGLLLFLHRATTRGVLLADSRLRLAVCPRDEVTPQIRLRVSSTGYDIEGDVDDTVERANRIWEAFLEMFEYATPQPRLSEYYYETRRTILQLYNIDEAFVANVNVHVTLSWFWAVELMMETLPQAALRRLELVVPSTPMPVENTSRTRLLCKEVHSAMEIQPADYQEFARYARSWVLAPGAKKTLSVTIYSDWTDTDVVACIELLNRGHMDTMTLKVRSACALGLAMAICARVQTVTDLTLEILMTQDWETEGLLLPCTSLAKAHGSSLRTFRLFVSEVPSMSMFVDAMLSLLEGDGEQTTTRFVIEECGEFQLHTRVNEPRIDDLAQLTRLLTEVGSHTKVLHIGSYASSEFYNEETYAMHPEEFKLSPVLTACPKLRLLNVQGAVFDDLPELFEQGATSLRALQIQWAPVESTVAVAQALSQKGSLIATTLVEFATRVATDQVLEGFLQVLEHNSNLRFLRVGRRERTDVLAIRLTSHHHTKLEPGSAAFVEMLETMAAAGHPRAMYVRDCMDDNVMKTIVAFVGSTVYRQILLR